jgi:hypothetical protein
MVSIAASRTLLLIANLLLLAACRTSHRTAAPDAGTARRAWTTTPLRPVEAALSGVRLTIAIPEGLTKEVAHERVGWVRLPELLPSISLTPSKPASLEIDVLGARMGAEPIRKEALAIGNRVVQRKGDTMFTDLFLRTGWRCTVIAKLDGPDGEQQMEKWQLEICSSVRIVNPTTPGG